MGEVPHLAPENTKPVEMGYVPKMLNHNTYVIECRNRFSLEEEHVSGKQAVTLVRCDLRCKRSGLPLRYMERGIRKSIKKWKQKNRASPTDLQQGTNRPFHPKKPQRNPIKLPSCGFPLMLRGTCWASPQGPLQTKQRWVSQADWSPATQLRATGSNLLVVSLGIYLGAGIWLYYIITTPQVVKAVKAVAKKKKNQPQHHKGKTALLRATEYEGGSPHAVQ